MILAPTADEISLLQMREELRRFDDLDMLEDLERKQVLTVAGDQVLGPSEQRRLKNLIVHVAATDDLNRAGWLVEVGDLEDARIRRLVFARL